MQQVLKLAGGAFALTAFLSATGLGVISTAGPAEAAFNESRWFLQNVCLARTHELLGTADWNKYLTEAKQSRGRLRQSGVPERHLREMEEMTTRLINASTNDTNKHEGPDLCIQWYKT